MMNYGSIISTAANQVGTVGKGIANKKALEEQQAANAQNQALVNTETANLQNTYDTQMQPYVYSGANALNDLNNQNVTTDSLDAMKGTDASSYNFNMDNFETDPGYEFRKSEGINALDQSAAGDGSLYSGGAAKDLMEFGQNLASDEYQNVYDREFGEFNQANTDFNNARDYNTNLSNTNIQNEYDKNMALNTQGYDATSNVANTDLSIGGQLLNANTGYNTASGDLAAGRYQNFGNTFDTFNKQAGEGAKDFFSFGG